MVRLNARTDNSQAVLPFTLQSRGLMPDSDLPQAARGILGASLGKFARRIRMVHVWLEDINGPRGGIDTQCRIDIQIRPHGKILASAIGTNDRTALTKAGARAERLLDRRTKRSRDQKRYSMRG
jgi:hypothetical protein